MTDFQRPALDDGDCLGLACLTLAIIGGGLLFVGFLTIMEYGALLFK